MLTHLTLIFEVIEDYIFSEYSLIDISGVMTMTLTFALLVSPCVSVMVSRKR